MLTSLLLTATLATPAAAPTFEKDVLPIFQAHCLSCHGEKQRKGELDLRNKAVTVAGGESGPALAAGAAEKSLLWIKVVADKMPPGDKKLSAEEKGVLKAWIDAGAPGEGAAVADDGKDRLVSDEDRKFWSFQKPTRPGVPTVKESGRVRNSIDAFLLAALEKQKLTFSPEADRAALLRRVTFDLTGLPPTPKEIDNFLADKAEDAYEKVVDRLLASPRYGERWARHWLDVAGYADSEGILDADHVRTSAWRYRDYVIKAFNADKPYDRFLQEQIAGDELTGYHEAHKSKKELPPEVVEGLIATGYLRCASDTSRPDFVNIKNAPGYYYQTLDDTLKIVASSVLGLTLNCARCHSHKFDPIPQRDYYRMQAILMGAYRPAKWVAQADRRLFEATAEQQAAANKVNAAVDAAVRGFNKELDAPRKEHATKLFEERLKALPEPIREDTRLAVNTDAAKRTEVQKYLAGKFEATLKPTAPKLDEELKKAYPAFAKVAAEVAAKVATEQAKRVKFPEIRALYDVPGEVKTPLLRRGDYLHPGPEVTPGVLAVLSTPKPFDWKPTTKDAPTTGRRLAFAEWLTQPEHPLTTRVIVNRLWLHHFGEGIVRTPEDFGKQGASPTHPELLDWLATELVEKKWSLKAMHRLMVTSSAYRQSSRLDEQAHAAANEADPENRLLWRQRLRRLEAEAIRDSVLSVAGTLSGDMYGAPLAVKRMPDGEVVADPAAEPKRSIYLQVRRSQPLTILQAFDQPVIETNCTRRGRSTVASQALVLLNSEFLTRQAAAFAARVTKEKPNDSASHALLLAFGRPATTKETATLTAFLTEQTERHVKAGVEKSEASKRALADLCHMLLGANEFAYVD